jgi:uncharacterized protein YggU (UPF0235/DUF167 family)
LVREDSIRITVRAKPRAKRSRITRALGLSVDIDVAAPPVDNAANEAIAAVIARALAVPKRAVTLVLGGTSRNKVFDVSGITAEDATRRFSEAEAR